LENKPEGSGGRGQQPSRGCRAQGRAHRMGSAQEDSTGLRRVLPGGWHAAMGRGGGCAGASALHLEPVPVLSITLCPQIRYFRCCEPLQMLQLPTSTSTSPSLQPAKLQGTETQHSHQARQPWPPQRSLTEMPSASKHPSCTTDATVSWSSCNSREDTAPSRPAPRLAEPLRASWEEHQPRWEQSSVCIMVTGRAGRGVSFLSRKAWRGWFFFFLFVFLVGLLFPFLTKNVNETKTIPRKGT